MNSTSDSRQTHLLKSSLYGVFRGLSVHTLIYPLEVIKIRQQCSPNAKSSIRVALNLFRHENFGVFYQGLAPQLLKTSLKQLWCWPMITGVPIFLQPYSLKPWFVYTLTGLSIASVDAAITTPLERSKILSAYKGRVAFSFKDIYKNGWHGFTIHLSKLSVNWITFLTAQKYLRDRNSIQSKQPLSNFQLIKIGIQVALIVSLMSAPFDIANTLKQAQNINSFQLFSKNGIRKLYRGWPLSVLSLIIHNTASVIVLSKLDNIDNFSPKK